VCTYHAQQDFFKNKISQAPVAYAYNPSYLGGRDQKDHGSNPTQTNRLRDPISKKYHKNRTGGVAQSEGPEFKSQYCKKKPNKTILSLSHLTIVTIIP
jgi:hypothetical protein